MNVIKTRSGRRRKIRIKRLEESSVRVRRKLANPKDKDDPRWVGRHAEIISKLIEKKERSLEHKQSQRKHARRRSKTLKSAHNT